LLCDDRCTRSLQDRFGFVTGRRVPLIMSVVNCGQAWLSVLLGQCPSWTDREVDTSKSYISTGCGQARGSSRAAGHHLRGHLGMTASPGPRAALPGCPWASGRAAPHTAQPPLCPTAFPRGASESAFLLSLCIFFMAQTVLPLPPSFLHFF